MKRNGFTLIELLAVIVILAIIALVAIPIILNVVEKTKSEVAKNNAINYVEAVEKYAALHEVDSHNYRYDIRGKE